MNIIKQNQVDIDEIAQQLKQGKIIVYPTETCYGIGCRADKQEVVDKLFAVKDRDKSKPVLVLVSDTEAAQKYIKWNLKTEKLAKKFWPGPLTLVAELKDTLELPEKVAVDDTLALRVSPNELAKYITKQINFPLVSTSANISNQKTPYSTDEIKEMYKDKNLKPDIVIDGGQLDPTPPSTIVDSTEEVQILRAGSISNEEVFKYLE